METKQQSDEFLNLLLPPAFTASNGRITALNRAAAALNLEVGQALPSISEALTEQIGQGCLYGNIAIGDSEYGAAITRMDGQLLFLLDGPSDEALQAMALASKELRGPISALISSVEALHRDAATQDTAAAMERNLNRLTRIVCNMSDAGTIPSPAHQEVRELNAFIKEIVEKCAEAAGSTGIALTYSPLDKPVYSLCSSELLERAVLNILSNALKFTPAGGTVKAELLHSGQFVQIRITDSGSGIAEELRSSLFRRYLRRPAIEEGRMGLGLGLVIVRSAAIAHSGTVLIDRPEGSGTRVTLTLKIRQNTGTLRSDIFRVNYAGEMDSTLLELSDVLPTECYKR